ncbi:DUF2069 domain-containing protein [Bacterioplanoides sp.]|uniref:DUF2069 domain-containing protein n=1 Tax=Bacterioplanoides sp. TaxID=2066072 RepID=UPI003B591249
MKTAESRNTSYAYSVMLSSYLAIITILLLSTFSNPPQNIESTLMFVLTGTGIWLFKILPLMLFIPGLIKRAHKSAAWLSYMSMLYFILAVLLAFTPGASGWGWGLVLASMILFISSMLFTRWKKADENNA